ncbi:MAG TPA: hypothetical protein VI423_11355, partial [Paenisporosarcina sp.]|nr:hypothetical protein [Paenisporosarcina sp.]
MKTSSNSRIYQSGSAYHLPLIDQRHGVVQVQPDGASKATVNSGFVQRSSGMLKFKDVLEKDLTTDSVELADTSGYICNVNKSLEDYRSFFYESLLKLSEKDSALYDSEKLLDYLSRCSMICVRKKGVDLDSESSKIREQAVFLFKCGKCMQFDPNFDPIEAAKSRRCKVGVLKIIKKRLQEVKSHIDKDLFVAPTIVSSNDQAEIEFNPSNIRFKYLEKLRKMLEEGDIDSASPLVGMIKCAVHGFLSRSTNGQFASCASYTSRSSGVGNFVRLLKYVYDSCGYYPLSLLRGRTESSFTDTSPFWIQDFSNAGVSSNLPIPGLTFFKSNNSRIPLSAHSWEGIRVAGLKRVFEFLKTFEKTPTSDPVIPVPFVLKSDGLLVKESMYLCKDGTLLGVEGDSISQSLLKKMAYCSPNHLPSFLRDQGIRFHNSVAATFLTCLLVPSQAVKPFTSLVSLNPLPKNADKSVIEELITALIQNLSNSCLYCFNSGQTCNVSFDENTRLSSPCNACVAANSKCIFPLILFTTLDND